MVNTMNPIDLSENTLRMLAELMDDETFETYLYYYDEDMEAEVIHLMNNFDKKLKGITQ